jgi:hypothetical protein
MTWLLLLLYGGRPQVLLIRGGQVQLWKGKIPHRLVTAAQDVVDVACLRRGVIYRNHDGRWGFSFGIPPEVRQRFRNVLACR